MPSPDTQRLKSQATNTLGPRLDAIFDLVSEAQQGQAYDGVWDCCCDHGYLGLKILAAQLCPTLYFVDQISHIIEQLASKLHRLTDGNSAGYKTIAADASELSFPSGQRHLVILAGVGGEHIVDIMRAIEARQHNCQIDYLLCPTTTQFDLREYLVAAAFDLQHESLVAEKGRDYEVIWVSARTEAGNKVSLTGGMWDESNGHHQRYRNKLMTHYQKQTRGRQLVHTQRAARILSLYQGCLNRAPAACEPA